MKIRSIAAVTMGLALAAAGASAQQIEEITVTAQKRSENLQSVPISITALTAKQTEAQGIKSSEDFGIAVPGLAVNHQSTAVLFYLRGVGTAGAQAGNDPAVANFIDGVYIPSMSGTTFSLNNIERIEVLKGPQGTLYGRNATGGAVNVITRTPSHDCSGDLSLGYGNHQTVEAKFYGTTGLSDKDAADIAGYYSHMGEGFGKNLVTGNDVNKRKSVAARSKILIEPSDATTITLAGDFSREDGSVGMSYRAAPTASAFLTGEQGFSGGFYDANTTNDPDLTIKNWGGLVRIEHELDGMTLTSLTGLRHSKIYQEGDVDAHPIDLFQYYSWEQNKQWTQELQLASNGDGRLQWITGAFFLDQDTQLYPFYLYGNLFGGALNTNSQMATKSIAAFAQATYALTDATKLTLGIRETQDKRTVKYSQTFTPTGLTTPIQTVPNTQFPRKKFTKPTWRVALDHQLNDDTMVYASYSRGFKSGVFNLTSPADPVVKPETLDAFEIGVKSDLLENRLRLNAATFYYKYKEMQLTKIVGASQTLLNAGKAEIYGVDFDLEGVITDQLTVHAGGSILHAKYEEFDGMPLTSVNYTAPFGNNVASADGKGNQLLATPKFTGNISIDYRVPISTGEIAANLTFAHKGKYPMEPDGRLEQEATDLLNAQIGWTSADERWNLTLWGKNITEEKYYFQQTAVFLGDLASAAPGRTFGATVGLKF